MEHHAWIETFVGIAMGAFFTCGAFCFLMAGAEMLQRMLTPYEEPAKTEMNI